VRRDEERRTKNEERRTQNAERERGRGRGRGRGRTRAGDRHSDLLWKYHSFLVVHFRQNAAVDVVARAQMKRDLGAHEPALVSPHRFEQSFQRPIDGGVVVPIAETIDALLGFALVMVPVFEYVHNVRLAGGSSKSFLSTIDLLLRFLCPRHQEVTPSDVEQSRGDVHRVLVRGLRERERETRHETRVTSHETRDARRERGRGRTRAWETRFRGVGASAPDLPGL
jgi:hypothetical protein